MKVENISRFKKERFLLAMSEDDFRDKVVRPLFLRSGYLDGRDLCGPSEHGKDAIFIEEDKLGFQTVIAVQTKKGKMNLARKASNNLVEAIAQLKTALESTVILVADKRKVKPNRVILCTSGKINEAARLHVVDEVRNPNVQFLDADDLIPRIDEKLPEFWLGIEADILPYYQAVQRFVLGESTLLSGKDGQDGVLRGAVDDSTFVGLNLFRTTLKKQKYHGKTIEFPDIEEFPLSSVINKKGRRILIVGDAGSGKSTGLMRIALELARRGIEEDATYCIPILIKATELDRYKPGNFISYCDDVTRQLSNTAKHCFTLDDLSDGRVVILFDGIDEISSDFDRAFAVKTLANFSGQYPKCQIIVTARPYKFLNELPELKSFDEYRISPISWKQAEKIVATVTQNKQISKTQSQEFLRRLEKIHGIELNPLLVTVFAATTDYTKQDIPANITELFKKFTELMLGRWDEKKGLKHQYQAPLKDFVLTKIAFHMHNKKKTTVARFEAENVARDELLTRGHEANAEQMLSEIFDRSGLFREVGQEIEFRHHLLQEFFAGRGIDSPDFVKQAIADEWWKRSLVFYFGENPNRIELLTDAMKFVSGSEQSKLLEAATTVGLALQACYLSPVSDKLEIWKWVATSLALSQDASLREADPDNKYPLTQFFNFYLYSRDSVALSHLKQNVNELTSWAESSAHDFGIEDEKERLLFWLVVGLVESGEISDAEKVIKNTTFKDGRILTAIALGCHLAHEIRPLNSEEKEKAREICERLESKVSPYRRQLISEFGSALLEYRNGEVKSIDKEVNK